MNVVNGKAVIIGILFLLILGSGYWLSRSGKPYNSLIFNIHKLIGLAAGVFLIVTVVNANRASPLLSVEILAIVVTVLIFILLVAAGGLLGVIAEGGLGSLQPALRAVISWEHKIFPYLAVISTALTLYLLLGSRQG